MDTITTDGSSALVQYVDAVMAEADLLYRAIPNGVGAVRDVVTEAPTKSDMLQAAIEECRLAPLAQSVGPKLDALAACMRELRSGAVLAADSERGRNEPAWCEAYTKVTDALDAIKDYCRRPTKPDNYVGPYSPSEWCERFDGISLSTFSRMRKAGELRVREETTTRIWIHPDDVNRYEKK